MNCGAPTDESADSCEECGTTLNLRRADSMTKSRITAGLLALFLGLFGAHKFYMGHAKRAWTHVIWTFVGGIGLFWAWFEAIQYLIFMDDQKFNEMVRRHHYT